MPVRLELFLPPLTALFVGLMLLLTAASYAQAQSSAPADLNLAEERVSVDRGPLDHLGHGTAEDLFVELGAGAKVSVFSGNLVLSLRPLIRGDALADSQMALTYNHLDAEGSAELVSGWRYDLGRSWSPGAWGDRVLVDGDGFHDSFLAAPLPSRQEALQLADDLVRSWRQQTPLAQRRAAGGEQGFRQMIAGDPIFFAEMRLRYLGRPPSDRRARYQSNRRGQRSLLLDDRDEHVVLTRHDGGTELYGESGELLEVRPRSGAALTLIREGLKLREVQVDGSTRFHIDSDSYGRVVRIRSQRDDAELQYADRLLHRLITAAGQYEMTYDTQGRLVSLQGPEGSLAIEYSDRSGRVARARGPYGDLVLGDLAGDNSQVTVALSGSACGKWQAAWNPVARERRLQGDSEVLAVRFEKDRPLPIEWSSRTSRLFLEWSQSGLLLSARNGAEQVRFERSADDLITALIDAGGARARMVRGEQGSLLGWLDPAGRRTRIELNAQQLPIRLNTPGGGLVQLHRTRSGALRKLEVDDQSDLVFRRDGRGFLRTLGAATGGGAVFRRDALGRVTGFEAPGGLRLTLGWDRSGRLSSIADGSASAGIRYAADGRLAGWGDGRSMMDVERAANGQVQALSRDQKSLWSLSLENGEPLGVIFQGGLEQELKKDPDGVPVAWERAAGGRIELLRDRRGRLQSITDPLLGDLKLKLDPWGRAIELYRGNGTWKLERDRAGQVLSIEDPLTAVTRLSLAPSGKVQQLAGPDQLTWALQHDSLGRLIELRDGSQVWSLRYGKLGLPQVLVDPRGREARIDWDSAGRWRRIEARGELLEAAYSELGPTRVGDQRRFYSQTGELMSWMDSTPNRSWKLDRDPLGAVLTISLEDHPKGGPREVLWQARLARNPLGRPTQIGAWRLKWQEGRITELQTTTEKTPLLRVDRDSLGRVQRLERADDVSVEVSHDPWGDVERLLIRNGEQGEFAARVRRDAAARATVLELTDGIELRLQRDLLSRARSWRLIGIKEPFEVRIRPLDGSLPAQVESLALELNLELDRKAESNKLSGSRRVEVSLGPGLDVLRFDEVRDSLGALQATTNLWESALGAWEHTEDPIGAQLATGEGDSLSRKDKHSESKQSASEPTLLWGAAPLLVAGQPGAPALDGSGMQIRGDLRFRLASEGQTISWLGSGATLEGLAIPGSDGALRSPPGWSPSEFPDPSEFGKPVPPILRGTGRAALRWWAGLGLAGDRVLASDADIPVSMAPWLRPYEALFADSLGLHSEHAQSGAGIGLPPLPGAQRLAPGRAGFQQISPLTALILAGDLPLAADEHEAWSPGPQPIWNIDFPGVEALLALARQRSAPSTPVQWHRSEVAGTSALLSGFATRAGTRRNLEQAWAILPVLSGLPPATRDLLPGPTHADVQGSASLPSDGRSSALEALSLDPLSPTATAGSRLDDERVLLLLQATAQPLRGEGNRVPGYSSREQWRILLPSGSVAVIDGRGRLLFVDAMGRLTRAWGEQAVESTASALLQEGSLKSSSSALLEPRWLPAAQGPLEARWGLLPARQELPLLSSGHPVFLERAMNASALPALPIAPVSR